MEVVKTGISYIVIEGNKMTYFYSKREMLAYVMLNSNGEVKGL